MKKSPQSVLLVIFLIIIVVNPVMAQIEMGVTTVTDYVWRGSNVLGGTPAAQPSITYSVGESGLAMNAWVSWALADRDNESTRDLDELDLTLSYDRQISNLGLSLAYIHYSWFSVEDWPTTSTTYEVYLGLGMPEARFAPSLTVYYDPTNAGGDGMYTSLGGGYSMHCGGGQTIDASLSVGFMDQSYVTDAGISDINYSLSSSLGECRGMTLSPSFTFTFTPENEIDLNYFIFSAGLDFAL